MGGRKVSFQDRFWSKVNQKDDANGCWNWIGSSIPSGYGKLQCGGREVYAHRASWAMENGPIPDGMVVMHSCDNPRCVNPGHLSVGTTRDNVYDKISKGRARWGTSPGEKNRNAVLTAVDVELIRSSPESQAVLASRYGLKQGAISKIRCGRTWRHLPAASQTKTDCRMKLTEESVRKIRERCAEGEPQPSGAREYGVTGANISAIVRRRTWRGVA